MLKVDRDNIRKKFVSLVREVPCEDVLPSLFEDGIISHDMVLEILEKPASERNCFLLLLLQRRGPKAFCSFVKALKRANRDLANHFISIDK